jgi:hypothetical protein
LWTRRSRMASADDFVPSVDWKLRGNHRGVA